MIDDNEMSMRDFCFHVGVMLCAVPAGGWAIQGAWDPREAAFAVLNQETGPDIQSVYMTVAADLVIAQIAEPVR